MIQLQGIGISSRNVAMPTSAVRDNKNVDGSGLRLFDGGTPNGVMPGMMLSGTMGGGRIGMISFPGMGYSIQEWEGLISIQWRQTESSRTGGSAPPLIRSAADEPNQPPCLEGSSCTYSRSNPFLILLAMPSPLPRRLSSCIPRSAPPQPYATLRDGSRARCVCGHGAPRGVQRGRPTNNSLY